LFFQSSLNHDYSSTTSTTSSSSSSSSSIKQPQYSVAKVNCKGEVSVTTQCISEILKRIHARDLFSLSLTSTQESEKQHAKQASFRRRKKRSPTAILPRQEDIIVSFGPIRAVIGPTEGMIFDAHKPSVQLLAKGIGETFAARLVHSTGSNYTDGFATPLQEQKQILPTAQQQFQEEDSFEFIFLEEILKDVCLTYTRRLQFYEPIVETVVTRVSNDMLAASGVHRLVPVKDSLQDFELLVKSALTCLTDLLGDDEDMLGLLLTEKMKAKERGRTIEHRRHESVELLLEEYARRLSNILQDTNFLLKKVQTKQELVSISLDAHRNRMLRMNLYLSMAGVSIASSTAVAGFYGMNLINGLEDSPTAFWNVVSVTSFMGAMIGIGCLSYLRGTSNTARTLERLREIEVIDGALSPPKMRALDYTMKILAENKSSMTKDEFREKMLASRQVDEISGNEIDLLFDALDISKDGKLNTDDFRIFADFGRRTNYPEML
jgi:magnesium transporter